MDFCNCVLALLIIVLVYLIWSRGRDNFAPRNERAEKIMSWFSSRPLSDVNYKEFKNDVPIADILDYNAAKDLAKKGNMNAADVKNALL